MEEDGGPLQARRAIEALRAGVPNRDAVAALGCDQPEIEDRCLRLLQATRQGLEGATQPQGLLVAGDFGSGKSHLLEYLRHLALEQGFVCSKLVVSKETPLNDPAKVYRAAVQAAAVPGKQGAALTEIAAGLRVGSPAYERFAEWANSLRSGLDSRFAATVFVYSRENSLEVRERILAFWGGDPLTVGELRRWLKAHGEAASFPLDPISVRELVLQRFRFLPRLIGAAGYGGWVLLVDETELIGRYPTKQRARAYAELARWSGQLDDFQYPGLAAVFALTADFAAANLDERNDLEQIPARLRASGLEADLLLASQAERGMRTIERQPLRLQPPTPQGVERTREQVRSLHARAYGWSPPPLAADRYLSSTRMRQHIRRWINEWDLKRLYPDYAAETEISDVRISYAEDADLAGPSEWDAPEPPDAEAPGWRP